jgi:hypothetical protein
MKQYFASTDCGFCGDIPGCHQNMFSNNDQIYFFLPQVTCQYATKNYTNATSFLHKTMISRSVWFVASHVIMLNTLFRTWMMQRGMLEQDSGIHCCHGCLARCLINHFTACAVRSARVVPCASHSTARHGSVLLVQ